MKQEIPEMTASEAWAAIAENERRLPGHVDAESIEMYVNGSEDAELIRAIEHYASAPAVRRHIDLWQHWLRSVKAVA